ncbi:MAG: DVUA0089 family protein [Gammaproteobacteria bacterium]
MRNNKHLSALVATLGLALFSTANASNLSFTGNFTRDDDVQLFNFTVGVASTVRLVSWSYAGGVNAAGTTIAEGGFDPILSLFTAAGTFIDRNDDGGDGDPAGSCPVATSAVTGQAWDTCFDRALDPGNYIVAVAQFDNFHINDLGDGFQRSGGRTSRPSLAARTASFAMCRALVSTRTATR